MMKRIFGKKSMNYLGPGLSATIILFLPDFIVLFGVKISKTSLWHSCKLRKSICSSHSSEAQSPVLQSKEVLLVNWKEYCLGQVSRQAKRRVCHLGLLNECVQLWLFLNSPVAPQDFQSTHWWTSQLLTSIGKTQISIKPPGSDCLLQPSVPENTLLLSGYWILIVCSNCGFQAQAWSDCGVKSMLRC